MLTRMKLLRMASKNISIVPNTLVNKVARRWLVSNMDAEYDILCRLQILEGVAGIPAGTWANRGRRGLVLAQGFENFKTHHIQPEWFSTQPSGMYALAKGVAEQLLHANRIVHVEADDVLNNILAGVSSSGEDGSVQKRFYVTGVRLKDAILSGKDVPMAVAKAYVAWFVKAQTINAIKGKSKAVSIHDLGGGHGEDRDEDTHSEMGNHHHSEPEHVSMELLTSHSTLGHEIREFMRKVFVGTFAATSASAKASQILVDELEHHGRIPSVRELGDKAGMTAQSATAMFRKAMASFQVALVRNHELSSKIEAHLIAHGVSPQEVDPNSLFAGFKNINPAKFAEFQERTPAQKTAFLIRATIHLGQPIL